MEMLKEFKEFALKGNVVDLAVAVIIGGAFGKIVTSFVNDIITPLIGILIGGINFADLSLVVNSAEVKYGAFIQSIIDFLIIAVVLFLTVKAMNTVRRAIPQPPVVPPAPTTNSCPQSATEIPIKAVRCPN